jgi:hypothetical protein
MRELTILRADPFCGPLNNNPVMRLGWNWKGSAAAGKDVFRISFFSKTGYPKIDKVWNYLRHVDF